MKYFTWNSFSEEKWIMPIVPEFRELVCEDKGKGFRPAWRLKTFKSLGWSRQKLAIINYLHIAPRYP